MRGAATCRLALRTAARWRVRGAPVGPPMRRNRPHSRAGCVRRYRVPSIGQIAVSSPVVRSSTQRFGSNPQTRSATGVAGVHVQGYLGAEVTVVMPGRLCSGRVL